MRPSRRNFLTGFGAFGALAGCASASPLFSEPSRDGLLAYEPQKPAFNLENAVSSELRLSHFDVVEISRESVLLRAVAKNGAFGVVAASPNKWWEVKPLLQNLVLPYLEGEDVRELEQHWWRFLRGEYEYAGNPLWNAWGHAETAILDLLGQASGKPVADLLGGVNRRQIPMYISGGQRGGEPQAEVDRLAARLETTGCKGVKIKIGRRMGRNADASEGWTPAILSAVRKAFGEDITLYADANGAYDAPTAISLYSVLEDHGVSMLEEPCSFLDTRMTAQITEAYRARGAKVLVASGENEGNPVVWRDLIDLQMIDVGQPDPQYGGGLLHCMLVAKRLEATGLKFNPHWPRQGAEQAPLIHLSAAAPSLYGLQEYRLQPRQMPYGHSSSYKLERGVLQMPDEPGFGVSYDPKIWESATRLSPS